MKGIAVLVALVGATSALTRTQWESIQRAEQELHGKKVLLPVHYKDYKDKSAEEMFKNGWVPLYPSTYTIRADFGLPYINLVEPVRVSVNSKTHVQSIGFYDELDFMIYDINNKKSYEDFVRMDHRECHMANIKAGPTGVGSDDSENESQGGIHSEPEATPWKVKFMPSIELMNYTGKAKCTDSNATKMCHHWVRTEKNFQRTSTYAFQALDDEVFSPKLYTMVGYDVALGSHYDLYNIRYNSFVDKIEDKYFMIPDYCKMAEGDREEHHNNMFQEMNHLFSGIDHGMEKYNEYIERFNLHHLYDDEDHEFSRRHGVFLKNYHTINQLNRKKEHGSATFALNPLAHLETHEHPHHGCYRNSQAHDTLNGKPKFSNYTNKTLYVQSNDKNISSHVDWRTNGGSTVVKDQATCGSCWSFAAISALESQWFIQKGEQVILSTQQLVDCSWDYNNNGCDGGDAMPAFQYIMDAGGIMKDQEYQYIGQNDYCHFDKSKALVRVVGIKEIPSGDEEALKDALYKVGPVSVAYDASHPSMTYYSSGVYHEPLCKNTEAELDHAVVVIGYGTTEKGEDYWLVKNSWSTYFGEMGYFRIARNKNNHCGIATSANFPVVA